MMPKVVVFDLGKVLVDFDWGRGARQIAAHSQLPADGGKNLFDYSPALIDYELGRLTTGQFFEKARGLIRFTGSRAQFEEAFADIFFEIPAMIELHALLRQRGVPTFIFSNTNDLHIGHIRRQFPFFSQFDGYVLSYEHGVMKPDAGLYEVVERQTGQRSAAILYLDDRAENVAAGLARGWQAFLHQSPEETRAFVGQLGLLG